MFPTFILLQEKLAEEKGVNNSYSVKVQNIEEELEVLRKDNTRLVRENMCLRYGEDSVKNEDFVENETFRTTDDEYEAPNDENETTTGCVEPVNITEKTGEVHSMDVLNDEDLKCNRDYTEKMHVTNDSTLKSLPVTQLMSSDQERNYEADDALSEEHVSPQTTEARKKRRNLKNRSSSQHNHRKDDTNSSLDEDATNEGRRFGKQKKEDAVDINENLCPDNHLETIESLQSNKEVRLNDKFCNSSHLSCTSANMNGDNNLDTTRNPTKISVNNCKDSRFESETTVVKVQQSFPDSMDAESYSWGDDNGEGTATMESLESDNN
ncbi:unnamed protein product [Clavelina lepadiformis]|uniref:Uncharacterized protein n=1 Tax=Clavelina lepadiformis TaxID=159417 RepID=A0ABP0EYZ4_CLALP